MFCAGRINSQSLCAPYWLYQKASEMPLICTGRINCQNNPNSVQFVPDTQRNASDFAGGTGAFRMSWTI
eukprot:1950663-Rhodomonas_salina.1